MEQAPLLPATTQQVLAGALAAGSALGPKVCVSRQARGDLTTCPGLQPALREVLLSAPAIEVPPLRARGADLVELAETCCRRHARLAGKAARRLDAPAAEALLAHHEEIAWRRNLTELDELIAAAVGRADGGELTAADLRLEAGMQAPATAYTIVSLDIAGSTELKRGEPPDRVEASFGAFHRWVEEQAREHEGEVYITSGDGVLLRFVTADAAVQCAIALVEGLAAFNEVHNQLSDGVAVRLGVHSGEVPAAPRSERGRVASPTLDVAAELQQSARPGEVLVSAATYALLSHTGALRPLRLPLAGLQVYSL
jgi:class 3 adenylate cyclase